MSALVFISVPICIIALSMQCSAGLSTVILISLFIRLIINLPRWALQKKQLLKNCFESTLF